MYDPIEAASSAPDGPRVAAVFDLDNTLLSGWSVLPFARDVAMTKVMAPAARRRRFGAALLVTLAGDPSIRQEARQYELLLELAARSLRGRRERWLADLGERIHDRELSKRIFPRMRELVTAHARRGHTLVLASASTRFQAEPVARELGFERVICSQLAVRFGRFTGELEGPACVGPEKRDRVLGLIRELGAQAQDAFFYSDGHEDVPLLESVGRPVVVNPGQALDDRARAEDWPVLRIETLPSEGVAEHVRRMLKLDPREAFASWFGGWSDWTSWSGGR